MSAFAKFHTGLVGMHAAMIAAIKEDTKTIAEELLKQFSIMQNGEMVSADELQAFMWHQLSLQEIEKDMMCCALTSSNRRCMRKQQPYSKYCKTHAWKETQERKKTSNIQTYELSEPPQTSIKPTQTIFIDDSLYLIDDDYIYDKETCGKVGYIQDGKPVLTDDPFELGIEF
jgi:hypothetical protein